MRSSTGRSEMMCRSLAFSVAARPRYVSSVASPRGLSLSGPARSAAEGAVDGTVDTAPTSFGFGGGVNSTVFSLPSASAWTAIGRELLSVVVISTSTASTDVGVLIRRASGFVAAMGETTGCDTAGEEGMRDGAAAGAGFAAATWRSDSAGARRSVRGCTDGCGSSGLRAGFGRGSPGAAEGVATAGVPAAGDAPGGATGGESVCTVGSSSSSHSSLGAAGPTPLVVAGGGTEAGFFVAGAGAGAGAADAFAAVGAGEGAGAGMPIGPPAAGSGFVSGFGAGAGAGPGPATVRENWPAGRFTCAGVASLRCPGTPACVVDWYGSDRFAGASRRATVKRACTMSFRMIAATAMTPMPSSRVVHWSGLSVSAST